MGFFSGITDTLFGDSGEGAAEAQGAQNAADRKFFAKQAAEAKQSALPLFHGSQLSQRLGSQQALDALRGGLGSQLGAFQQGNVGAQQTIAGGQDAFSRAILGLPPLEQQAPVSFDFDTSFAPENIQFKQGLRGVLQQAGDRRREVVAQRADDRNPANFNSLQALGGGRGFGGLRGRR